ncbi:MAG: ROK family protein, partial [Acutalibacteraceae bacterium]|nr:ROK family protein [Acutalibacteraceae bacterium]
MLVLFIGVDIGGTKCAVTCGLKTKDGKIEFVNKSRIETKDYSEPYDVLEKLAEEIEKFNIDKIEAIGISCGGPLDSASGVILSPPNLPGWDNIKITEFFKNRFGVEAYLQNDANACALAEGTFGAGAGTENLIFLTFGTGLGAGLILNGQLYEGTSDSAGELGHIRLASFGPVGYGKMGSFEGFCSGGGIAQLAKTYVMQQLQMGKQPALCPTAEHLEELTAEK